MIPVRNQGTRWILDYDTDLRKVLEDIEAHFRRLKGPSRKRWEKMDRLKRKMRTEIVKKAMGVVTLRMRREKETRAKQVMRKMYDFLASSGGNVVISGLLFLKSLSYDTSFMTSFSIYSVCDVPHRIIDVLSALQRVEHETHDRDDACHAMSASIRDHSSNAAGNREQAGPERVDQNPDVSRENRYGERRRQRPF